MERDTASLVTGKKGGREKRREEGEMETAEKRIGADMRTDGRIDGQIDRKIGWARSKRAVRLHQTTSVFDA